MDNVFVINYLINRQIGRKGEKLGGTVCGPESCV